MWFESTIARQAINADGSRPALANNDTPKHIPVQLASVRTNPLLPVPFIVPFAPGGASDVVARIVSVKLAEALGQPFIVDNRAGAGGSIGAELMVRAQPEGYTIMSGAL